MSNRPHIRLPAGLPAPAPPSPDSDLERQVQDVQTLREIVAGLDRLEERLDQSPIPKAVTARGYFTPDEDDRVRQSLLSYRNYRLAAYEIILRSRSYASVQPLDAQMRAFLLAFGAALVLYAKSLRIVAFAEHVPLLRAKLNEPDMKFDLQEGFFDDVLACYSQFSNLKSLREAAAFWRGHRRQVQTFAKSAGGDWLWLTTLIGRQRWILRGRLLDVLLQRLRYDWRAFCRTLLSPFRQARRGVESMLGGLADVQLAVTPTCALVPELLRNLRPRLRPGDVLLMRTDNRITTAILPGFWAHAALFVGTCSDLESLGLRQHPHVAKHWQTIVSHPDPLGSVIESVFPFVQLTPLEKCLQVDHLLVFRAALPKEEIAGAIAEALGHLGKPYDFDFDFNSTSRIVCTGLIYRSYHGRGGICFSLCKRLGRFTLSGDDIVAQVVNASSPSGESTCFSPIALVLKHRDGQAHLARPERMVPLLRRLGRGWRPTRRLVKFVPPTPREPLGSDCGKGLS
jgi:Permuted papain-like amidase enzyme, YaeF/YiiX, C92 family